MPPAHTWVTLIGMMASAVIIAVIMTCRRGNRAPAMSSATQPRWSLSDRVPNRRYSSHGPSGGRSRSRVAQPPRTRSSAARGDELIGLLADLAAPGARRLDVRSALDLVRGGWATRLRERPPLGPWLLYRLFGTRSLRDHLGWVADDIAGALFPLRHVMINALVMITALAIIPINVTHVWAGGISYFSTWSFWIFVVIALSLDSQLLDGYRRWRAIEAYLLARTGERVTAGSWVRVRAPRRRVTARAALPWAAAAPVGLLVACVAAAA